VQSQVAEFQAQGLPGDPQESGGLVLIPSRILQNEGQQEAVHPAVCVRVEVLSIRTESLTDECFQVKVNARLRGQAGFTGTAREVGQEGREQDSSAGLQQGLLQRALQLPDVARPVVAAQALQRLRGNLLHLPPQIAAEAPQEVPHQHQQIIAALAQGGHVDSEDTQPVVQIRPEFPAAASAFTSWWVGYRL
jgi:hypothetical protein